VSRAFVASLLWIQTVRGWRGFDISTGGSKELLFQLWMLKWQMEIQENWFAEVATPSN